MANPTDTSITGKPLMPWQSLLATAEKNASIISSEVINDTVLGKSVTAAVSPYFAQSDTATFLREEYAAADLACREARQNANVVMRNHGMGDDWQTDDLKAADEVLWGMLTHLTKNAGAINKKRAVAAAQERELFDNTIDVIDTCAGIAALRHLNEFRCEGDAFCCAYVAALSIADYMIGKSIKSKGVKLISDFLQYSVGTKTSYREADIYLYSKTAFGIGRTMGIESSNVLRSALILAIKKNATTPSQLKSQIETPAPVKAPVNTIDFKL